MLGVLPSGTASRADPMPMYPGCQVERKVRPTTSRAAMDRARVDPDIVADRARRAVGAARAHVIRQLVRAGIPPMTAEPLVDEWLRSTEMLRDFQAAPDFWHLAYQFALEEYHRRRTAG